MTSTNPSDVKRAARAYMAQHPGVGYQQARRIVTGQAPDPHAPAPGTPTETVPSPVVTVTDRTYDLSARFVLDETAAAAWADALVAGDTDLDGIEIGPDWNPLTDAYLASVDSLVQHAQTNGVITAPPGVDLFFSESPDEDGGTFCFLVDLGFDLRLASFSRETRKLTGWDMTGTACVLDILTTAVATGNTLLTQVEQVRSAPTPVAATAAGTTTRRPQVTAGATADVAPAAPYQAACTRAGLDIMTHVLDVIRDREQVPEQTLAAVTADQVHDWYFGYIAPAVDQVENLLLDLDNPDAAVPPQKTAAPPTPADTWVCSQCGSSNVLRDAYVAVNDPADVRQFDSVTCDDCGHETNLVPAHATSGGAAPQPPLYQAAVTPQAWQNDYAVDVDPPGDTTWIVSDEYARRIPTQPDAGDLDFLIDDPNAPAWLTGWSGPFLIETDAINLDPQQVTTVQVCSGCRNEIDFCRCGATLQWRPATVDDLRTAGWTDTEIAGRLTTP